VADRAPTVACALLLVATVLVPSPAAAARPAASTPDGPSAADLAAAGASLETASQTTIAARSRYVSAQALLPSALETATRSRAAVGVAQQAAAAADRHLQAARQILGYTEQRRQAAEDELQARKAEAASLARALYEAELPPGLSGLLVAQDTAAFVDRAVGVSIAGTVVQRRVVALDHARFAARSAAAAAQEQAARVAAEQQMVADRLREAQAVTLQADAAAGTVEKLVRDRASALAQSTLTEAADRQRYEELRAQSARVATLLAQAQAAADARARAVPAAPAQPGAAAPPTHLSAVPPAARAPTPDIAGARLQTPTAGPVVSPYGARSDPVTGQASFHPGLDIAGPTGQPIMAAQDGVVVVVQSPADSGGYGNYTCIDHGNDLATCYAHQSAVEVSLGEWVTRGQEIGRVGSTGYSTGPHLHFEVRLDGETVDPQTYL